jgi:hypothetical protein
MELHDVSSDSGMEMRDLLEDDEFRRRRLSHDTLRQSTGLRRLISLFEEAPATILQELVSIAVELCHADSAGISLEEEMETGEVRFRWIAVAGSFEPYLNGTTPRFYSPCGACLSAGRAQLYRVTQPYYQFLGVEADDITDGMLIPWMAGTQRGTIWAVSHRSSTAFDFSDYDTLQSLADFVTLAVTNQHEQQRLRTAERQAAYAAKANELAHQINNPLQSLTNTLFLASRADQAAQTYVAQACNDLAALSETVRQLLTFHAGDRAHQSADKAR